MNTRAVQLIACDCHAHLASKAVPWLAANLHHLFSNGAAVNTQSRSSLTSYAISRSIADESHSINCTALVNTVTFVKVTYLAMLCPQNAFKTQCSRLWFLIRAREQSYACEVQTPMQERWVWFRATFALLPRVIMQVSSSKFTLNHSFMGLFALI